MNNDKDKGLTEENEYEEESGLKEKFRNLTEGMSIKGIVIKVLLVAVALSVVFYLVMFTISYGKADLFLSNQEMTDFNSLSASQESFKAADKVFFIVGRKSKSMGANQLVLEIEKYDAEYKHHKQISYELDKEYLKMGSFIPTEYFVKLGKYRIKAFLDGKEVAKRKLEISE